MNHKKTHDISRTGFLWIIIAILIICTSSVAQTQPPADPNEEKVYFDIVQIKDINQLLNPLTGKKLVLSNEAALKLNEMISKSQPEIKDRISIQPLIEQKQLLIFGDEKVRQTAKLLLKHIDSESFIKAQQYDIININYVDVNEVADSLHTIFKEFKTDYTNKVNFVPLPELKQLLIFGDKEYCEIIKKLTKEYPPLNNHLQRKSFQLKYAEPLDVKNKIDEIFGDGSASNVQRSRTISSNKVITTTYPSLKQVIVLAPEETMKEIEKLIMEWDSPIVFQEMRQTEPNEQR